MPGLARPERPDCAIDAMSAAHCHAISGYEQAKRAPTAVDEGERLILQLLDEEYTRHPFYGSRRMTKYYTAVGTPSTASGCSA